MDLIIQRLSPPNQPHSGSTKSRRPKWPSLDRNRWPICSGMGGRIESECPADLKSEWVADFVRNPHFSLKNRRSFLKKWRSELKPVSFFFSEVFWRPISPYFVCIRNRIKKCENNRKKTDPPGGGWRFMVYFTGV